MTEPVPAPATPSLAAALEGVERFLGRYVIVGPEALTAVVLWIAHTHALGSADATPYLAITSPEKQSGKTRLLECLALLAHDCPGISVGPTPATIYRTLEATPEATLLLDELDAVFGDRSERYEEVRSVINAGHRRGATVPRSVPGPKHSWEVKRFAVFCPKALAGIGALPDTVADRSIPIRMRKRKLSEPVVRFRVRFARAEATPIVEALTAALAAAPPAPEADLPAELPDRAADGWEPLLAIADAAGDGWPARARRAALILHARRDGDVGSLGLRLLADIRAIFAVRGIERLATVDLLAALAADEEGPWASERHPLTAHRLARLLAPFEIGSKQLRLGATTLKGYERIAFVDAWERYLPSAPSPLEAKHRNTDPEQCFDVSDQDPPDGQGEIGLAEPPIEIDYPQNAWDPDAEPGEPGVETRGRVPLAEPGGGGWP